MMKNTTHYETQKKKIKTTAAKIMCIILAAILVLPLNAPILARAHVSDITSVEECLGETVDFTDSNDIVWHFDANGEPMFDWADLTSELFIDDSSDVSWRFNTDGEPMFEFHDFSSDIFIDGSDGIVWHFDSAGNPRFDLSEVDLDQFFTWHDHDFCIYYDIAAFEARETELQLVQSEYIMVYLITNNEIIAKEVHRDDLDDVTEYFENRAMISAMEAMPTMPTMETRMDSHSAEIEIDYFPWPDGFCFDAYIAENLPPCDTIRFYYLGWDETIIFETTEDLLEEAVRYHTGRDDLIVTEAQMEAQIKAFLETATLEDVLALADAEMEHYFLRRMYYGGYFYTESFLMSYEQLQELMNTPEETANMYDAAAEPFTTSSVTVSTTSWRPGASAQTIGISIIAHSTISWSVSSNPSWLTIESVSPSSQRGNGSFTARVTANTGTNTRSGTILVLPAGGGNPAFISVTQAAPVAPTPTLTLSRSTYSLTTHQSSSGSVSITSNQQWNFSSNASWLTIAHHSPFNRTGNGSITFGVQQNATSSSRTGTITVTGGGITRTLTVTQPSPPVLVINPTVWSAPASQRSLSVSVESTRPWNVSVASNAQSWLSVSPSSGTNRGSFTVTASTNPNAVHRTGRITVSTAAPGAVSQHIDVTQAGAPPSVTIQNRFLLDTYRETQVTLSVSSNTTWNIPVSNDPSWLPIHSWAPTNRVRNGTVTVRALQNPSATTRTGSITVSAPGATPSTAEVVQPGAPARLSLNPTNGWPAPATGGSSDTINITANRGWIITSSDPGWLNATNITPAIAANRTGNGSFRITATANSGATQRSGSITVSIPGTSLSQSISVTQLSLPATLSISPIWPGTTWSVGTGGGSRIITVSTNRIWTASATSNIPGWLSVSPSGGPVGGGEFLVSVTANSGVNARSGTITVSAGGISLPFMVSQAGGDATLRVTPTTWNTASTPDNRTITVESNGTWSISSSAPTWLTFSNESPASRTGPGSFRINVTNNHQGQRNGTITVTVPGAASQTIAVSQAAQRFRVTFNPNGGTLANPSEAERMVDYRNPVGTLPAVNTNSRTGHTFGGWANQQTGGSLIDASLVIAFSRTLYARWDPIIYNITFNPNGGTGGPPIIQRAFNTAINLPTTIPTRTGYNFAGWFRTPTGGYQLTELTVATEYHTRWYARWTPQTLTVNFFADGGSTPPSRSRQFGAAVGALPESVRIGYTLVGWFTALEGGRQIDASEPITQNVTFFARWNRRDYRVDFNPTGGTVSEPFRWVQAGSAVGELPQPSWPNYAFVGWFRNPEGTGVQITPQTLINGNEEFFAVWDSNAFTIVFDPGLGTVDPEFITRPAGAQVGTMPTPILAGHMFTGWFTVTGEHIQATSRPTTNLVVFARWEVGSEFTITFDPRGGAPVSPASRPITPGIQLGSVPSAPRRQGVTLGHYFAGWFNEATGAPITAATVPGNSSIVAYARWECNVARHPTRLHRRDNGRSIWYYTNNIPLQTFNVSHPLILANYLPIWSIAMEQGRLNWNNSGAPAYFQTPSSSSNNEVLMFDLTYRYPRNPFGTYQDLERTDDGLVNRFRVRLCPVFIPDFVDRYDLNLVNFITYVMVHELGHALGLRDGGVNDHPTILGGSRSESVMNAFSITEPIVVTMPTAFDVESVRLVYDH